MGINLNRKLVMGAMAGVAAIALTVVGATYSLFTDSGLVKDNVVGTGILKLDLARLGQQPSLRAPVGFDNLLPGQESSSAVWLASNDAASTPKGTLAITIANLRDYENGCGNDSEAELDPTCADSSEGDGMLGGELSSALLTSIDAWSAPTGGSCAAPSGATVDTVMPAATLRSRLATPMAINLPPVSPGHGYCVRVTEQLPADTGNAVQSDSLAFDLTFTLTQASA